MRQQLNEKETFSIDKDGNSGFNNRLGEGEEQISAEVLSQLGKSEELLALLQNRHLREFLLHANSTHNPKGFIIVEMMEPLFVEFADACLKIIHPGKRL